MEDRECDNCTFPNLLLNTKQAQASRSGRVYALLKSHTTTGKEPGYVPKLCKANTPVTSDCQNAFISQRAIK